MTLEYDTQKLYEFYKSDPRVKQYINSLPTDKWLPELQRVYDDRYNSNTDEIDTIFGIAAVTMVAMGLFYLI